MLRVEKGVSFRWSQKSAALVMYFNSDEHRYNSVLAGKNGTIVPARDPRALAEALLWHFENRDTSREMGRVARGTIESHFRVEDYEARMIGFYESLMKSKKPAG